MLLGLSAISVFERVYGIDNVLNKPLRVIMQTNDVPMDNYTNHWTTAQVLRSKLLTDRTASNFSHSGQLQYYNKHSHIQPFRLLEEN